MLLPWWLST